MLLVEVPEKEWFDERSQEFIVTKREVFQIEHSLVSLSKWESKWEKPFLDKKEKTDEEVLDYIRCMTITQNVDPNLYTRLPNDVLDKIDKYINASMTATWFSERDNKKHSREIITSEIIYYWMVSHNIPFECQKWHLNRLLTLIRVCNIKNSTPKKPGRKEMLNSRAALNQMRKEQLKTKG